MCLFLLESIENASTHTWEEDVFSPTVKVKFWVNADPNYLHDNDLSLVRGLMCLLMSELCQEAGSLPWQEQLFS